jgi:arylsulfatase A-like enzyme
VKRDLAGRPNILVIVTDDQRDGINERVMPKTVEWLRNGGCEFTHAVTVSPICGPSRASIMTGLHVHHHTVWTNNHGRNLPQTRTLQRHLREAGYRTALMGKFINGWRTDTGTLLKPNPFFWNQFRFAANADCMFPNIDCGRPGWKKYNVNGRVRTVETYPTTYISRNFARFVDAGPQPWFAYLCPPNPHAPYGIQDRYASAPVGVFQGNPATGEDTPAEKADKPAYIRNATFTLALGKEKRKKQFRSLMSVDDMIDDVLTKVKNKGQLANTLVFLLSDNGMLWSEHTWGKKRVPYEQSIRIPFFVRGPGFASGTSDTRLVANIDLAPTVYRAAGITDPPVTDGRALQDDFDRGHMLIQYFNHARFVVPKWAAVVTKSAKYTEYYEQGIGSVAAADGVAFTEYYDLQADPWELKNRKVPPDGQPFKEQLNVDRNSGPPVPDGAIGQGGP